MSKKIALFGSGIWGRNILRELTGLGVETDVFDTDPGKKSEAERLGASSFAGTCEHPEKYDGIIISTPSSTHRDMIYSLAQVNVPVFMEKPLTLSKKDADDIKKLAPEHLFMMHIWLYHPGIERLAEIARNESLGKVLEIRSTRANWTSPRTDSDSAWNLLPHDITITKAILGYIPKPEYAVSERHAGVIRGMMAVLGSHPACIFEVSNRYEKKVREVRVHCQNGIAVLENEKVDYLTIVRGDDTSTLNVEKEPFDPTPPLRLELIEFLRYLDGGPPPRSTLTDGLEVISTIQQLCELSENNNPNK